MTRLSPSVVVACVVASPAVAQIDDLDRPPINYKNAQTNNVVR